MFQHTAARRRLLPAQIIAKTGKRFNTQPHGGGCRQAPQGALIGVFVSTHSRTEAAASLTSPVSRLVKVSTHSRTEAAAPFLRGVHCIN